MDEEITSAFILIDRNMYMLLEQTLDSSVALIAQSQAASVASFIYQLYVMCSYVANKNLLIEKINFQDTFFNTYLEIYFYNVDVVVSDSDDSGVYV